MNAILSLFLSFAMLFSGSALPATVDTVSTLTVQDLTIGYNDESYSLGFDVALSAAAAQDELRLHFEAVDQNGDVLMPISGSITPDGVTFAIDDEGSAFTVSAETFNQMLGLEEGDVSSIETMVSGVESYVSAIASLKDQQSALSPETEAALMDVVYANLSDMLEEEMVWDFGNGEIPAIHVNGTLSGADLFAILDGWMALEDESLSPALSAVLDLYNTIFAANYAVNDEAGTLASVEIADSSVGVIGGADGPTDVYAAEGEYVPAESFTQLIENIAANDEEILASLEQISAEVDIITGEGEDTEHQVVNLFMILDEAMEYAMNITAESNIGAEESDVYFALYLEQGSNTTSYDVQTIIEGPVENPTAVNVNVMLQNDSAEDYTDYDAEEPVEDILYTSTGMYLTTGSFYDDGLEDTDVYLEISESNLRYTDGETTEEDSTMTSFSYFADEEWDEDHNLIADYEMYLNANDEENLSISFNTVLTKNAAEDYFADLAPVDLPADGEDPAYESLSNDFAALMEDLMIIASNEDFAAMASFLSGSEFSAEGYEDYEEEYEDEEYYDEEYSEEIYEDSEEEYVEGQYGSLEEAQEMYNGKVVSYNPPEGFDLEAVVVSNGDYLYADYYSEDGRYISLNQNYSPEESDMDYFVTGDGAASMLTSPVATVYKTETGYYYAQFYTGNESVYLYFDDCDAQTVETILAGLEF